MEAIIPDSRQAKFLVVDDQRCMRAYVRAILAEFNAQIIEAENGEAALRRTKCRCCFSHSAALAPRKVQ
jgi:response regulator RpfG family c-di-GMP phosphodiesterase